MNLKRLLGLLSLLLIIFISNKSYSLETSYLTADSSSWNCEFNPPQWTCVNKNYSKRAILTVNSQIADDTKSLKMVAKFLNKTRARKNNRGITELSKIIFFKQSNYAGKIALEALHYQGELSNYYSHYIILFVDDLLINYSFHAHKDIYKSVDNDFIKFVNSSKFKDQTLREQPAAQTEPQIPIPSVGQEVKNFSFFDRVVDKVSTKPIFAGIILLILGFIISAIFYLRN